MAFHRPAHDTYHVGRHQHVETPYDKQSALYHPDLWNWHDLYDQQVSYKGSIVTRSQTAFNRINIDETGMQIFGDKMRHNPPNLPHLVVTMKDGVYGAIPRTIITRSMAGTLENNPTLSKTIEAYKSFQPLEALTVQERRPSLLNRFLKKDAVDMNVNNTTDKRGKEGEKHGIFKSHPSHDLKETSPSNNGPVRYIEQPKICANTSLLGGKQPLLRESKFSQEVLGSLSQPKVSSSSAGLLKLLKEPSFTITQHSLTHVAANFQRVESQPRGEDQKYQAPFPSIPFGVSRKFSLPAPVSRVLLQNQEKRFPQFQKQPPSLMFK